LLLRNEHWTIEGAGKGIIKEDKTHKSGAKHLIGATGHYHVVAEEPKLKTLRSKRDARGIFVSLITS
jgi:hypothetical protein